MIYKVEEENVQFANFLFAGSLISWVKPLRPAEIRAAVQGHSLLQQFYKTYSVSHGKGWYGCKEGEQQKIKKYKSFIGIFLRK